MAGGERVVMSRAWQAAMEFLDRTCAELGVSADDDDEIVDPLASEEP